jgi:multidrug efflux system outer membrane protein
VVANYLELRGVQSHLEVATRNATNQSLTLNLAVALRDGGQGTQLDVARARALHNETLASIPPLELAADRAIHRISVLCGLTPTQLRGDLSPRAPIPQAREWTVPSDPSSWIQRRPDIRAAERSLAAATERIGIQTADLFPRVTFTGSIGLQAKSIGAMADDGSDTFSFGPHITWAALDLGRVRQRIKAADARATQALDSYEQTVLLALEEAENSLIALNRERQRLGYITEAERAATEAAGLARQRYRDGIADYLSVLDAERTLLNLQEQLVTTQTQSNTRLVAVFKALAVSQK